MHSSSRAIHHSAARIRIRPLAATAGLAAALALGFGAASASAASTLNNEVFGLTIDPFAGGGNGDVRDVTVNCDQGGPESNFSFTVSGTASGSYPGTYTETANVTISMSDPFTGPLAAYDATFTIVSGDTTITGEKHLVASPTDTLGTCDDRPGSTDDFGTAFVGPGDLRYSATIHTSDGAFTDEGTSDVQAVARHHPSAEWGSFFEVFASDLSEARPLHPTSAEQCKKGGWQTYGIFKNQGDCIAFVQTGGKNEPGQNQPG